MAEITTCEACTGTGKFVTTGVTGRTIEATCMHCRGTGTQATMTAVNEWDIDALNAAIAKDDADLAAHRAALTKAAATKARARMIVKHDPEQAWVQQEQAELDAQRDEIESLPEVTGIGKVVRSRHDMTKVAATNIELHAALQDAWAAIRVQHPEVPDALVVVASGRVSQSGSRMNYGHFWASQWRHEDGQVHEVLIGGEGLERPADEVFGTLLHEAAHARNFKQGIQDTSRQGRYHNVHFKLAAEKLGMAVYARDGSGLSGTRLLPETAALYRKEILRLQRAMTIKRSGISGVKKKAKKPAGWLAAQCACTGGERRRIRVTQRTYDLGPVVCGTCLEPFTLVNPEDDLLAALTGGSTPKDRRNAAATRSYLPPIRTLPG